MTIKRALAIPACRLSNMGSNLRYHRCAEGDVRHEVAVHDIDLGVSSAEKKLI
jgi:hypothetical protein